MARFKLVYEFGTTKLSPAFMTQYATCQTTHYKDTKTSKYYLVKVSHYPGGFKTMIFESNRDGFVGTYIREADNTTREEILDLLE